MLSLRRLWLAVQMEGGTRGTQPEHSPCPIGHVRATCWDRDSGTPSQSPARDRDLGEGEAPSGLCPVMLELGSGLLLGECGCPPPSGAPARPHPHPARRCPGLLQSSLAHPGGSRPASPCLTPARPRAVGPPLQPSQTPPVAASAGRAGVTGVLIVDAAPGIRWLCLQPLPQGGGLLFSCFATRSR